MTSRREAAALLRAIWPSSPDITPEQ